MTEPGNSAPMRPEEALQKLEAITSRTGGLRTRTEGLTLVIWAICIAASYLTIAVPIVGGRLRGGGGRFPFNESLNASFNNSTFGGGPRGPPPTEFFYSAFAPILWFVIAVVVTFAIWRSVSIGFQTGMTTPRLVATFVGWVVVFGVTIVALTYVEGGNPRGWHLVGWAIVMALFVALNPLRFAQRSRWAMGAVTVVVALAAIYALVANLDARDTSFLSGLVIGLPMLLAGLYVMLTG